MYDGDKREYYLKRRKPPSTNIDEGESRPYDLPSEGGIYTMRGVANRTNIHPVLCSLISPVSDAKSKGCYVVATTAAASLT